MTIDDLKILVREIVAEARRAVAARTAEANAPVNYACIFAQSAAEYEELVGLTRQLGSIVQETAMGPVFHIMPLATDCGDLRMLKIRRPDPKRREKGDADFTVADYESFKKTHLGQPGFNLIKRPKMEMIELIDPACNALAYFSHPTLGEILKI